MNLNLYLYLCILCICTHFRIVLYLYCTFVLYCIGSANINMETFMLTGFKFESPQQYWIPDNHFMRLNVSCLLTARRDFSYFETFWSEFKPENGQLVQNKADTKAYVGVFSILFSVRFVLKLALYFCCT